MVLSAQTLRRYKFITPFFERTKSCGLTFGVSPAGYDIRIDQEFCLSPNQFVLASSIEHFNMPTNVIGIVHDKSTWARRGLCVQNTVIEPGWRGYLTLELTNHSSHGIFICQGSPIAQVVFHALDEITSDPYDGKYQDQERGPQKAR